MLHVIDEIYEKQRPYHITLRNATKDVGKVLRNNVTVCVVATHVSPVLGYSVIIHNYMLFSDLAHTRR